ncbi:MAG: energy-coupling factor transporter transmembrane component T [Candidatus Hodarchaeales archaeon]
MAFVFRNVYQGFLYRAGSRSANPLTGFVIVAIQFTLMLDNDQVFLTTLLFLLIIENITLRKAQDILILLKAIFPLLVFLGGITFLFGGFSRAMIVVLRILISSLSFSLYFALTNPSELSRALEKLKIPASVAIIPALALTVVPSVSKDAEETFNTLVLRGELEGHFWNWLPKALAVFIASVLYRSEFLAQSLYIKGYGLGKRTHYRSIPIKRSDVLRTFFWLITFIIKIIPGIL